MRLHLHFISSFYATFALILVFVYVHALTFFHLLFYFFKNII